MKKPPETASRIDQIIAEEFAGCAQPDDVRMILEQAWRRDWNALRATDHVNAHLPAVQAQALHNHVAKMVRGYYGN